MDYIFHICHVSQQAILGKKNLASSRLLLFSNNLTVSDKMLDYLIYYVLIPKHSNHSQIGDLELQLMYAIKNKIHINWAYIIMYHMKHQQSLIGGLPHARLITKFLEGCGFDLKRKPKKKVTSKECEINASTSIRNTGIFLDMDDMYKYKYESSTSPNAPPPAPEGGYSIDVLYNKICSVKSTMMRNYREQKFEMASIKRLLENLTKSPNPEIGDEEESGEDQEEDEEGMGMSKSD